MTEFLQPNIDIAAKDLENINLIQVANELESQREPALIEEDDEEEEEVAETNETCGEEKKKKKKKKNNKKKKKAGNTTGSDNVAPKDSEKSNSEIPWRAPLSRLLGGNTLYYLKYGQTEVPSRPVSKLTIQTMHFFMVP